MIVIPRKKGQSIIIDDNIILTVVEIHGDKIRLQVECPSDAQVRRAEMCEAATRPSGVGFSKSLDHYLDGDSDFFLGDPLSG